MGARGAMGGLSALAVAAGAVAVAGKTSSQRCKGFDSWMEPAGARRAAVGGCGRESRRRWHALARSGTFLPGFSVPPSRPPTVAAVEPFRCAAAPIGLMFAAARFALAHFGTF